MTSPFFFGTILEIDGDMSRRTALVETRDWSELDLCGFLRGRSEENAVRGRLDDFVEESW